MSSPGPGLRLILAHLIDDDVVSGPGPAKVTWSPSLVSEFIAIVGPLLPEKGKKLSKSAQWQKVADQMSIAIDKGLFLSALSDVESHLLDALSNKWTKIVSSYNKLINLKKTLLVRSGIRPKTDAETWYQYLSSIEGLCVDSSIDHVTC